MLFARQARWAQGKVRSSDPTENGNTNLKDGCHGEEEEGEEGEEELI
jgi:hypothetical protein